VPALNTVSQAQPKTLLTQHVREVVLNRQAPSIGRLPATQMLKFDIVLAMRDQAGFESFLKELYNPSSPFLSALPHSAGFYREVWSQPGELQRLNSIRDGQRLHRSRRVARFHGRSIQGSRGQRRVGFPRKHECLPAPHGERTFFAVDREPSVDLPFQLWHITGLDKLFDSASRPRQKKCGCEVQCHYRLLPRGIFLRQRYARGLLRREPLSPAPARTSVCSSMQAFDNR